MFSMETSFRRVDEFQSENSKVKSPRDMMNFKFFPLSLLAMCGFQATETHHKGFPLPTRISARTCVVHIFPSHSLT